MLIDKNLIAILLNWIHRYSPDLMILLQKDIMISPVERDKLYLDDALLSSVWLCAYLIIFIPMYLVLME